MSSKESVIPGHLSAATLNWREGGGGGLSLRRAVDLEIVLLRKVVCIYEKTFSSSFVRGFRDGLITARLFCLLVLWAYN